MSRKLWFALPLLAGVALLVHRQVPGRLADGTIILASGWRIHPAGGQITVGTLPLGLITLGDGSLMVTDDGYGPNGLLHVDPGAGRITDTLPLHNTWLGLARAGDTVWASGGRSNAVYRFVPRASGWRVDTAQLADSTTPLFAAGLAVAGGRVAVVGNVSDSLYVLDATTLARLATVPVGHHPYTVLADSANWYVSNWGDSSISVVSRTARASERPSALFVGAHPSALVLRGHELFAALAGENAVARLDLATGRVVEQLSVSLAPHAPTGSDPNALALSPDGRTLYVALAGNNAVAVVRVGARTLRVLGMIPAGWYPTALATSADGRMLYVANGKGNGSGSNADGRYIGNVITGSVSVIPVPDSAALARHTARVLALSPFTNPGIRAAVRPSGRPPVRHVVYVIRENRTYDQVFGDVAAGDGDASLAIFNDSITPNAHAIVKRWVLFDNFYVDGEVSADGHEWSDRAFAGDYNEKTWPAVYSGRRPWDLTDGGDLEDPTGRYLWDAARKKGLWMVNFGEMVEGEAADSVYHTNIAGLRGVTDPHYPSFILDIPDTVRARMFGDSVDSWDRQGRFPDLVIVYLPRDHTLGKRATRWTPRAMVAENDLAVGRVVDRLSRSPAWKSLALFALEDDAQNGPDHVDAHRSVLLLASPWARRGAVDSTFYTTSSVVRTIGLLLDLPPLSQFDAGAAPLWNAFAPRADTTAFAGLPSALAPRRAQSERVPLAHSRSRSGGTRQGRRSRAEPRDLGERAPRRATARPAARLRARARRAPRLLRSERAFQRVEARQVDVGHPPAALQQRA
jgi:YVTN family beta-propeller protein